MNFGHYFSLRFPLNSGRLVVPAGLCVVLCDPNGLEQLNVPDEGCYRRPKQTAGFRMHRQRRSSHGKS